VADTGTSTNRLMPAVLGGVQSAPSGRSRAKAKGKHIGRTPSPTLAQQKEATRRRAQGATLQELANSYRPQHIRHAPRHPEPGTPASRLLKLISEDTRL